jgi:5-methylcytosine-specific restriction enzyme A
MPNAPKRYQPHGVQRQQPKRLSPSIRGYDERWKKLRAAFLTEHPWCSVCLSAGKHTPATDVDHVRPFQHRDDPLRLDWNNLDAKCHACHARKTRQDMQSGATRRH